jgi:predicted AlkP superfamily phosphohydrolase/phosphomutase
MLRKTTLFLALISLIVIISILYFLTSQKEAEILYSPHIVIIGVDGAGWNLINPLLKDDQLPNIKYLVRKGSHGVLKTISPVKSSVIWTSIATGKSMIKHGIIDWTFINKNNIQIPYRQSERRVKAFWNILGELGWKVGVINWFITYPPERVNGYMVSEEFRHLAKRDLTEITMTYPKLLQKKLQFARRTKWDFPKIRKEEKLPNFRNKEAISEGQKRLAPFYANFVTQDKIIELASLYLFERYPVDVFATYFRLIDVVSHFACGYLDPELIQKGIDEEKAGAISPEIRFEIDNAFSEIMNPIYAYSDRILGRFLEIIGPQTTLIVVSDHGFAFQNGEYRHTSFPEIPHGIILITGPHIKNGYHIQCAHVYDILPTILYLFDLPIAKDMDGKVLTEVFQKKFLKKRPIRYIDSYEEETQLKEVNRDRKLDERALEELRALGYIKN